jgi:hypothetical protein
MSKKAFMPRPDLEKNEWLQNFAAKLPTYAAKYNIAAGFAFAQQSTSAIGGQMQKL